MKTTKLLFRNDFSSMLLLMLLWVSASSCQSDQLLKKYNGISLVASRDSLTEKQANRLIDINANAAALMPYAFLSSEDSPELHFNSDRQWFGERVEGIEQAIDKLHQHNIKVMMKPHIWLRNGSFTGDLNFKTDQDWAQFENSYREYILLYVEIAEKHQVELFCIGTELYNFVKNRPEFWGELIAEIRDQYHGKLVYAENWDKVDQTEIWKSLDYIGVDAYFPLSDKVAPKLQEIRSGWQKHKSMLKDLSEEYDKPVLFTEYGYRSIDFAVKEPWHSGREKTETNHGLQARALEATYQEFWTENWFAGGFLWKWHQHETSGGLENDRFTPQNKPAENTIKEYYRKFKR
ncbi:glycoside hydrolase family 113 [Christiangramia flava]|uniref:Uncharacterized protein n=1 Tax=Christiangramia flava JLT2011 TaxID=1229726 RepID=A0A1L7I4I3_9FLAO|nr:glycoside hydrolase [Christiangramia flava]APU68501.1 hypothetical protein GRFL_1777 [Christiangramia flava JLT2011]OSS40710.1 hypothetical protein C723_0119 [Christiangramia flava JLT2011]